MKDVPTSAATEAAAKAMLTTYAGLASSQLIERWAAAPAEAPGRAVSSPWPDRIEVTSSKQSGDKATVTGELVEMTSTGVARRLPVSAELERIAGHWLMTSFRESASEEDPRAAVAVIESYYEAISFRDFDRAYQHWGENGPPGQSRAAFAAGFAHTTSVQVTTGQPSQIGAAAGSRYVDVPVKIVATTDNGGTQTFEGTYTLRRAVVDGASDAERRWHLYRAAIRELAR